MKRIAPNVNYHHGAMRYAYYTLRVDYIHEAKHSDIAKLAEVLAEFGLAEIALIGEQAKVP